MSDKLVHKFTYKLTDKMLGFYKQMDTLNKMMFFYRYFSLFITSIFFAAGSNNRQKWLIIIVIGGVAISAVILNSLYLLNAKQKNFIKLLVLIETVGNALILIPTGGLNSPYLWYSLNTVLVCLVFLDLKYCVFDLLIYLIITTKISYTLFNTEHVSIWLVLSRNSNLILSFILISVASHLLISLLNKLKEEKNKLIKANEDLNYANVNLHRSIEYIMSINHAVHNLTNQRNASRLARLLIEYALDITKTKKAFFISLLNDLPDYENRDNDTEEDGEANCNGEVFLTPACKNLILKQKDKVINSLLPVNIKVNGINLILAEVKSLYQPYGILGIVVKNDISNILYKDIYSQMKLLSELGSIVFERYQLEDSNNRLLINDEQNRIANEIHDTVFQRLFGISCAIHKLMQRQNYIEMIDIKEELAIIKDSVGNAMKELREIVYKLSWRKKGENAFLNDILRYIEEISKLTGIKISFSLSGEQELLSCDVKRAIIRIIREGTGNAIRHSKCSNISISINIDDRFTRFEIKDDGSGFEANKDLSGQGLGLKNIYSLVNSLNGEVNINSQYGRGTSMAAIVPNNGIKETKKEEAV